MCQMSVFPKKKSASCTWKSYAMFYCCWLRSTVEFDPLSIRTTVDQISYPNGTSYQIASIIFDYDIVFFIVFLIHYYNNSMALSGINNLRKFWLLSAVTLDFYFFNSFKCMALITFVTSVTAPCTLPIEFIK